MILTSCEQVLERSIASYDPLSLVLCREARVAAPPEQGLAGKLAALEGEGVSASVQSKAVAICNEIDRAIPRFETQGVASYVSRTDHGSIVIELMARSFTLFFAAEEREEDSGWGIASTKDSGGVLAGGPLSSARVPDVLGMILRPRVVFQVLSFEESQNQITVVT